MASNPETPQGGALLAALGVDRKTMEAERLARRKRVRSISPPPLRSKRNKQAVVDLTTDAPIAQDAPRLVGLQYPKGVLKKTWVLGYDRKGDDIKIEEVLQKSTVQLAVLSSFDWDPEWVLSKFLDALPSLIFVRHAKDKTQRDACVDQLSQFPGIRQVFPPMEGNVWCMHSKLQLIFHTTYLRIVIPSANLRQHDWGENGGILENSVFLIDLPALNSTEEVKAQVETPFRRELVRFCKAMGLPEVVVRQVTSYDFAETQQYAFVHSIGGSHMYDTWKHTGYCGLSTAVRELGLATTSHPEVDFVSSSIGALTIPYLKTLYGATMGINCDEEFISRFGKIQKTLLTRDTEDDLTKAVRKHFRFYFPSRETVWSSKGKADAGGTNFLSRKVYEKPDFPRALMRDCVSKRPGMLMHNKMIFVRPPTVVTVATGEKIVAWAYHGSANISASAWGSLTSVAGKPKLSCRNWECGVVIVVPETAMSIGEQHTDKYPPVSVFEPHVRVPMDVPGEPYTSKNPWYAKW